MRKVWVLEQLTPVGDETDWLIAACRRNLGDRSADELRARINRDGGHWAGCVGTQYYPAFADVARNYIRYHDGTFRVVEAMVDTDDTHRWVGYDHESVHPNDKLYRYIMATL